jgi:hypothetical protein
MSIAVLYFLDDGGSIDDGNDRRGPSQGFPYGGRSGRGRAKLGELRVRSKPKQLARLLDLAEQFPERTWAVENATGLGYLLAQQRARPKW